MILRKFKKLIKSYVGVLAPDYLEADPWFGPAVLSESQEDLRSLRLQCELDNQLIPESEDTIVRKEDVNIHELMYNIAIKNSTTTTNLHEGWQSGTGWEVFK
jgi:hypothetical protein